MVKEYKALLHWFVFRRPGFGQCVLFPVSGKYLAIIASGVEPTERKKRDVFAVFA